MPVIKRTIDILVALAGIVVLALPMAVIFMLIKLTSKGPTLYWTDRIGRNNVHFKMLKFRTMVVDTPNVATHLLSDPDKYITPVGKLLRRFSMDELPQLFNILVGDMSLVGPRPALFNQDDLIQLRTEKGVHQLRPGLTGWAQVNSIEELPIPQKVALDEYYLLHQSIALETRIFFLTFIKFIR